MPISNFLRKCYIGFGYSNERIERLSPEDWEEVDPKEGYLKTFYDIELKDGRVFEKVYPNGGGFFLNGVFVSLDEVKKWKLSKDI